MFLYIFYGTCGNRLEIDVFVNTFELSTFRITPLFFCSQNHENHKLIKIKMIVIIFIVQILRCYVYVKYNIQ